MRMRLLIHRFPFRVQFNPLFFSYSKLQYFILRNRLDDFIKTKDRIFNTRYSLILKNKYVKYIVTFAESFTYDMTFKKNKMLGK